MAGDVPALPPVVVGLNAVILAVTAEVPRVLTIGRTDHALGVPAAAAAGDGEALDALPFGPLDPVGHRTLERGLRGWVEQQTGLELGYAEQLYTFGDRFRDPRERRGGPRVISAGYLALVHEQEVAGVGEARWRDVYGYLPWEDWREGKPPLLERTIQPALRLWAEERSGEGAAGRRERVELAFGLGAPWDGERTLERYELLYEASLVREAWVDTATAPPGDRPLVGRPMALDHRRILATALGRVRGKLKYRPVVFELMAPEFSLTELQHTVEAISGHHVHKQNFRRLVEAAALVEPTGAESRPKRGRPAALFRFRRDVLKERPAPGLRVGSR